MGKKGLGHMYCDLTEALRFGVSTVLAVKDNTEMYCKLNFIFPSCKPPETKH